MRLLLFILLSCPIFSSAQINELDQFFASDYRPPELNTTFTQRFDSIYPAYLAKKNVVDDKNDAFKDFVLNYNYFLDKLNKSGEIFYNNEISSYLNELKDTLLFDHPERTNIRVYLTNFTEVNAFTNDFGNVYMNVGLIAKMSSEDELYTVLAHEIAHVLLEHSFKQENRNLNLENGRKLSEVDEIDVFESHKFSQKQEIQADSLAFELLKKRGFDLSAFESAFELLRHSKNPIYNDFPSLDLLCSGDEESIFYVQNLIDLVELPELTYELDSVKIAALRDSFPPTHPTIDQRIEHIESLIDSNLKNIHRPQDRFLNVKFLASKVYLKKLTDEGNYIEGLFLVNQLRKKNPDDDFLLKTQLKQMLLLTQSKYQPRKSNQLLNEFGDQCDDENYLRFRWAMLQIPALEMNILTLLSIQNAQSNDPYLQRLNTFAYQFLYKHNRFLFEVKDGKTIVKQDAEWDHQHIQEFAQFFTEKERQKMKEDEEVGYQYVHHLVGSDRLVDYFLSTGISEESFNASVEAYKTRRSEYNKSLTFDQYLLTIDPEEFKKARPKGDYIPSVGFSDSNKVVIVESDTYAVNYDRDGADMDLLETARYNEMISAFLKNGEYFESFETNQVSSRSNLSVKENYIHYVLSKLVEDCWELSDLIYSSVDEEVQDYVSESNMDYLSYNLNIIIRDRTKNKTLSIHYTLYFDLRNMGVVYFSKVPNRNRLSNLMLTSIFSLPNKN